MKSEEIVELAKRIKALQVFLDETVTAFIAEHNAERNERERGKGADSEPEPRMTISQYQDLCAAVYQFIGANMEKLGGCRRFLDTLSNAMAGKPFDAVHLLPYSPTEHIELTEVDCSHMQRDPSTTEAPPEDFPVPAKNFVRDNLDEYESRIDVGKQAMQPQAGDVIAQEALDAYFGRENNNGGHGYDPEQIARIKRVEQVIVRAFQEEMKRVANTKSECLVSADECYREAARNLGLEVRE